MGICRLKPATILILAGFAASAPGQTVDDPHPASLAPSVFVTNLAQDQKALWSSPFKARIEDLNWLVPVAGLTAGLINADSELSSRLSATGRLAKRSSTLSDAGLAVAVGGGGGIYLWGRWHSDDHQRETGILSGEAAINALLIDEVFKVATRRERPTDGAGQGRFGRGSALNSSFPSTHAMITWSIASVLVHEYPGPLTKLLAYGLATGVSVARVTGKQHFPSDVLVGSTLGWMIGREVYGRHHDPELGGAGYGTFHSSAETGEQRSPESLASPYVPVDSWVYPAFERLLSLGVIPSGFLGMRPWTRQECARLLEESDEFMDEDSTGEASRLLSALKREFAMEPGGAEAPYIGMDSLYARATSISGPPLTDGYHFNETLPYDYGRPYERGMNYIGGFSSSGSAGALGFYLRAEYEHAPSAPGVSQAVQNAIQVADSKPVVQPATPIAAFSRPRVIEGYISLNVKGWQASFGKQSLWTGPTMDPFAFSNNAVPLYMFRVDQTSPRKLPGFLSRLGPYRSEFFFGQVTGQHYVNEENGQPVVFSIGRSLAKQPMEHFEKVSFKPTPNFEFGVSVSTMWGGPGIPITLGELKGTLFTVTNPPVGTALDPGDRRSYFNWSYRLPGLRKRLMIYEDSFSEDEISPIGYPRLSAHNPGLYLAQIPKLPHLDLRVEGGYTDLPGFNQPAGGGFYYWNIGYLDGHTNKGNIMGSTIGRQGVSFRAATTYWLASDKTIQLSYRNMETNKKFLQGGNLRDLRLQSDWSLRPQLSLKSMLQYEWWNFPLLTPVKQSNFTASLEVTYWPHWRFNGGK
ncbi:MAG TPA: capsule assembly Wzi family protein [Candidatus Angelobacter sp.]